MGATCLMEPSKSDLNSHDHLIQRYLDADLSEAECQAFDALLAQEDFCIRLAEYAVDTAHLYELGREGLLMGESGGRKQSPGHRRRALHLGAGVAALIAVVVLVMIWMNHESMTTLCQVTDVSGSVVLQTDQGEVRVEKGSPVRVGDLIRAEGLESYVQFAFADGTQMVLTDGAVVQVLHANGQKKVFLYQGLLSADVSTQSAQIPLIISTPQANAKVLGTRLSLHADTNSTELGVFTGHVQMTRHSDGEVVDVKTGQQAVAARQGKLVVVPISPTADTWEEDFETGLPDHWRCGQWITHGLPDGSSGGVLANALFFGKPRPDNYHCITTYKDWTRGLFRIHADSVLHVTYKLLDPGWFQIMICVRSDQEKQFHVGNYEAHDSTWWNVPAQQWHTVHIPLHSFAKSTDPDQTGELSPRIGDVAYMLFFNSLTQDIGLVIDRLWVTREATTGG